jgi:hypothetical protein
MANISSISTKWTITTHLTSLNTKKDHDIWPWKSRSWLGTSQKACNFIFWMLVYCHVEMYSTFQWFTWQVLPFITKVCMFYHSQINFSSPDSLDHVWYCYHLTSVNFNLFWTALGQENPNFEGIFIWKTSTTFVIFGLIGCSTWPQFSKILLTENTQPMKLLHVWMILGWSSTKYVFWFRSKIKMATTAGYSFYIGLYEEDV